MDMRLVWLFQSNCKRCHFLFMPWSLSFLSGIPSSLWPLLFYTFVTGQRQIILLLAEKKFIYQKQEYVILDLSARSIIDYTDWCNPLAIHVLSFCSEHLPMPMNSVFISEWYCFFNYLAENSTCQDFLVLVWLIDGRVLILHDRALDYIWVLLGRVKETAVCFSAWLHLCSNNLQCACAIVSHVNMFNLFACEIWRGDRGETWDRKDS